MVDKISQKEVGETLEVYMANMIMKSSKKGLHAQHLYKVFKRTRRYNMRINPKSALLG